MATKILVLDSTEGISDMLNFSLTAYYNVFSATTANDAIAIIEEDRPQLLICDIDIPDMDGIEFLCHIKKHYPTIEVIMISGDTNKSTGVQCLKYEASDFILKPVTRDLIEIVLERAKRKLAIRRKLSPSQNDNNCEEEVAFERMFIARQIVTNFAASQIINKSSLSSIFSLHDQEGLVVYGSPEYIDLFGQMRRKNNWEIYKGEASSKDMCPSSFAFSTKTSHVQKALIKTIDNREIEVDVFAAPLINGQKQVDLVIEIISLSE